jgi:hypothetical protein
MFASVAILVELPVCPVDCIALIYVCKTVTLDDFSLNTLPLYFVCCRFLLPVTLVLLIFR